MSGDGLKEEQNATVTGCSYPSCPVGMKEYNHGCYRSTPKTVKTGFNNATKLCQKKGDEIVSIHTADDWDYVMRFAQEANLHFIWIGYTDQVYEGIFQWTDGSIGNLSFANLDMSENTAERDCVVMDVRDGSLSIEKCDEDRQIVCSSPLYNKKCADGWQLIDGKCYSLQIENTTFYEAYTSCSLNGGDLISVPSQDSLYIITQKLEGYTKDLSIWISLQNGFLTDGMAWTGEGFSPNITWTKGVPECVALKSYNLEPHQCSGSYMSTAFICEKTPRVSKTCPKGSMRFGDLCHKLKVDEGDNGIDAAKNCERLGGWLVTIKSVAKNEFIVDYIKRMKVEGDYWIGSSENGTEGVYKWADDSDLGAYSNWNSGEPDDSNDRFDCVRMRKNFGYKWDDLSCDEYDLPYICEYYNHPCREDATCHANGECYKGQCRCKEGYSGDGKEKCIDINECIRNPCSVDAVCTNYNGSFTCECNESFDGNGYFCINRLACNTSKTFDPKCHRHGFCNQYTGLCQCKSGFEGNGTHCSDIDECQDERLHGCDGNATCFNSDGSHTCQCKDEYTGDGKTCIDTPANCEVIRIRNPDAKDGEYIIDPDSAGGEMKFKVMCKFYGDYAVTIVYNKVNNIELKNKDGQFTYTKAMSYENVEYEQLRNLVTGSLYCKQNITFTCRRFSLINTTKYTDVNDVDHVIEQCPCGDINACYKENMKCNCAGRTGHTKKDIFTITKSDAALPIIEFSTGDMGSRDTLQYWISDLICAPRQIEVPRDCNEAKSYYRLRHGDDLVILIDPDGPAMDSNQPFLAYCDVSSHYHVGITELPPRGPYGPRTVTSPGNVTIGYPVGVGQIRGLIGISGFCMQEMFYDCQRSQLLAAGSSFIGGNGTVTSTYWAGALGADNMCACGVTGTCVDPSKTCDCDASDSDVHKDFGFIVNKNSLPVLSVNFQDVGVNKSSNYTLKRIRCAPQKFGVPGSCQDYRNMGYDYSYTYLIDPDGPRRSESEENIEPFLVYCEMGSSPPVGCAVLPNDNSSQTLEVVKRSNKTVKGGYCKLNEDGTKWTCCELYPTCAALKSGYQLAYGQHGIRNGRYVIDPDGMFGEDPFVVNCHFPYTILYAQGHGRRIRLWSPKNTTTHGPKSYCRDITYQGTSTGQLRALTEIAQYCKQDVKYTCEQAPFTNMNVWFNREGVEMKGWAGSADQDECACGSQDSCEGGPDDACNCDANSTTRMVDKGTFINKENLPVSRICLGFEESNSTGPRFAESYVYSFVCSNRQFGIQRTCQDYRNVHYTHRNRPLVSQVYFVDPDGTSKSSNKPFPAFCNMTSWPPLGVTEITPSEKKCMEIPPEGGEIEIKYNSASLEQIKDLTARSVYCKQHLIFECNSTNLDLTVERGFGWYSVHGDVMEYWGNNTDGTGCYGEECKCNSLGNNFEDGGWLTNKTVLPVTKLKFAPESHGGSRCVTLGPLKCYTVYRNCEEIRSKGKARYNPNRDRSYAVDPDYVKKSDGGVDVFGVTCLFKYRQGISVVTHGNQSTQTINDNLPPASGNMTVTYNNNVTLEQIKALVNSSQFCKQKLTYTCNNLPLLNNFDPTYSYFTYGPGVESRSWSLADAYNVDGCGCAVLGTCPNDTTCRCDTYVDASKSYTEGGDITNRDKLPVEKVFFGGTMNRPGSSGSYNIGPVYCGRQPWDYPRNCEHARTSYRMSQSGEVTIQPNSHVDPFVVYCDFEKRPYDKPSSKIGVTVIPVNFTPNTSVPINGSINISYKGADLSQVQSLVFSRESKYCYLPVKLDCYATQFIGDNHLENYFTSTRGHNLRYLGHGISNNRKCRCGTEKRCGGTDGNQNIERRACNCDIGDSVWRADAGILTIRGHLPMESMHFNLGNNANATGRLTLGNLYCSPQPIDFNECELGFHDCHHLAECINTVDGYECRCKEGFRGLYRGEDVIANGRECPDDDECAGLLCPAVAECNNTYGSFKCVCKPGFKQTGPTTCEDIDECEVGTHNCDSNARCVNNYGSYKCFCKAGHRGNGTHCESVGICKCWGDPHCISFDQKITHFQGSCKYLMTRDGCVNGSISSQPTFEVVQKYWRDYMDTDREVSWVKEVYIYVYGHVIELKQKRVVLFNGVKINELPSKPIGAHPDLIIKYVGRDVVVVWGTGIEVKWSGTTTSTVVIPSRYKNHMCGMCGNYNDQPEDDWIIGDGCPDDGIGSLTTNQNKFGHSWFYGNDSDKNCKKDCNQAPPSECTSADKAKARQACSFLIDRTQSGSFRECISKLHDDYVDEMFKSCVFDMCQTKNKNNQPLCDTGKALTDKCQDEGYNVYNWRSADFCSVQCGENMVYKICGQRCQRTCENQETAVSCDGPCKETCECEDGMVLDGQKQCVQPSKCGCFYNGQYYSVGDRVMQDNCTTECYCNTPLSSLECTKVTCDTEAVCDNRNGTWDCYCNDGYRGDGQTCADIDECSEDPKTCHKHATCSNLLGSYNCTCLPGFIGDGKDCKDIDECVEGTHKCSNNTRCVNYDGSYRCACLSGHRRVNRYLCEDKDECKEGSDRCDRGSTTCNNTDGSYNCDCLDGFTRFNDFRCKDINECRNKIDYGCHKNSKCRNSVGSFSCTCKNGYTGTSNGSYCEDVDECENSLLNRCHRHAECTNTDGSYECECKPGYDGNGYKCESVDPGVCDRDCTTEVGPNSDCIIEAIGLYHCRCQDGYKMVTVNGESTCENKDECLEGSNPCSVNAKCKDTEGSYTCTCDDGYTSDDNGHTCYDIDECSTSHTCHEHAQCDNTIGSYTCTCLEHFIGDGRQCEDIDECENEDLYRCADDAHCENKIGGYICVCDGGYTGHCDDCEDIDECIDNLNDCHQYATCKNTPGSFECTCIDGFKGDGESCYNIDECEEGTHDCQNTDYCVDTFGSFKCACIVGFRHDENKTCADVNECSNSLNLCSPNAKCNNTIGSYICECNPGFTGDGRHCAPDSHNFCDNEKCDINAVCTPIGNGLKKCKCIEGFEGLGTQAGGCMLIDVCRNAGCDVNAYCIRASGAGICICKDGYEGNGVTCRKKEPCNDQRKCGIGATCVNTANYTYRCDCPVDFVKVSDPLNGDYCKDIDECKNGIADCPDNSFCYNHLYGYTCICDSGFRKDDNGNCTNINECEEEIDDCFGEETTCVDEEGSYSCQCPEGFVESTGTTCIENSSNCTVECEALQYCHVEDDSTEACHCISGSVENSTEPLICIDNDECKVEHRCHEKAICTNLSPGYSCACIDGYTGNGAYCHDINECTEGSDDCDKNADCDNTEGGYKCVCRTGYKDISGGNGTKCILHSPADDICGCGKNGICNSETQLCDCKEGFMADETRRRNKCQDKDECQTGEVCARTAICENLVGGYRCSCPKGYEGDGYEICDPNKCHLNRHKCDEKAGICVYVHGGYKCYCEDGYKGDGYTCHKKVDLCDELGEPCSGNSYCSVVDGKARCDCAAGYQGENCEDINECIEKGELKHDCDDQAKCINTNGAYICECHPGYMRVDGKKCVDVNECIPTPGSGSAGPCSGQADCLNTAGGFVCRCKPGFEQSGTSCLPTKGCGDSCVGNSTCKSTVFGGHVCVCDEGFEGPNCEDIDECADNNNNCEDNADCTNTEPGFTCTCKEGFFGDGKVCLDINECLKDVYNNCSGDHMICVNEPGSFKCECEEGYKLNVANQCVDVDECSAPESNLCSDNATCYDKPGSYQCECKAGFYGDGLTCTECQNKDCGNCADGYIYNGNGCFPLNKCNVPKHSIYFHECINADCEKEDNVTYTCNCKPGYKPDPSDNSRCIDKDECDKSSGTDVCGDKGDCYNTEGSYVCICKPGYHVTDKGCVNVDECEDVETCGGAYAADCSDTVGGYLCVCRSGYVNGPRGNCIDIDECIENHDICGQGSAFCVNKPGSYKCRCQSGYDYNRKNKTCHDIDECQTSRNPCHSDADCTNNEGSYTCTCKSGFIGNGYFCSPRCGPGVCNQRKTCIVTNDEVMGEITDCDCRCESADCKNDGKVCGSDGQTYDSDAALIIQACRLMKDIQKIHRGECKATCENTKCSLYKTCVLNENGLPMCVCDECTDEEWNSGEVCTVGGNLHTNLCVLKIVQCLIDGDDVPLPKNSSLSMDEMCRRDCLMEDWSPWSGCSVSCGVGTHTRIRSVRWKPNITEVDCGPLVQQKKCYSPHCPDSICALTFCGGIGEVCVALSKTEAECQCKICHHHDIKPLCGQIGDRMVTKNNLCLLEAEACRMNEDYTVLHSGKCSEKGNNLPVDCTVLNHYTKVIDPITNCTTKATVEINTCGGGCGAKVGKCCKPKRHDYIRHDFMCPNSEDTKVEKVAKVVECECTEDEEVESP